MTAGIEVPVTLHLDHCPERQVITDCLERGWNSVLFDASTLPVEENQRQTIEVVAEARRYGAHVEGEIEAITGRRGRHRHPTPRPRRQSLDVAIDFIRETGVDVFAPSIGNAHGVYSATPDLDFERVTDARVAATDTPIALHGGSGMTDDAVPRPHLARVRQGEHLDRAEDRVHAVEPRLPARAPRRRTSGIRRRCSPTCDRTSSPSRPVSPQTFGSAGKAW